MFKIIFNVKFAYDSDNKCCTMSNRCVFVLCSNVWSCGDIPVIVYIVLCMCRIHMCPAKDHFTFLTLLIISMTFVLSLIQMLVFLSLYVMLRIRLSILVCAATSLFCACLVSVQVSAPYVIAGSTQELYTCLFWQMARLLLKISQCLAYATHRTTILHCMSALVFSLRLLCCPRFTVCIIQHFLSAHCSR